MVWTIIALVGAAVGVIGVYVSTWAENHSRSDDPLSDMRQHNIALVVGLVGWVCSVIGIVVGLVEHFGK